jgi:hypothetical protein
MPRSPGAPGPGYERQPLCHKVSRRSSIGVFIGVLGVALLSAVAVGVWHRPPAQQLGVPAYWSPATASGREMFQQLARTVPPGGVVVVNGSRSAPQTPYDPAWAGAFRSLATAGVLPLGYVDTGYLGVDFGTGPNFTRPDSAGAGRNTLDAWTTQIEGDIDAWYALYGSDGLDGIFLDRTAAVCGPHDLYVGRYRQIADYVRRRHPGAHVVMNPGRSIDACYNGAANTFVTFEGPYRDYLARTATGWEATADSGKFWHLIYDAPDEASMAHAISLSKERNAGYVYVTAAPAPSEGNGHRWDIIPANAYWRAELTAVFGPSANTGRG